MLSRRHHQLFCCNAQRISTSLRTHISRIHYARSVANDDCVTVMGNTLDHPGATMKTDLKDVTKRSEFSGNPCRLYFMRFNSKWWWPKLKLRKSFITTSKYIGQFPLHFDRVSFGNGTFYGGWFFSFWFFFTLIRQSIYLFSVFFFILMMLQQLQNSIFKFMSHFQ